jgi:hypothetical protein
MGDTSGDGDGDTLGMYMVMVMMIKVMVFSASPNLLHFLFHLVPIQ